MPSRKKRSSGKKPAGKRTGGKPVAKGVASKKPASLKKAAAAKKAEAEKKPKAAAGKVAGKKATGTKGAMKQASVNAKGKGPGAKGSAKKGAAPRKRSKGVELGDGVNALLARLKAIAEAPENQNCVWLVELVIPPGSFIARRVPEPVDYEAFKKEHYASMEVLRHGGDRNRFLIWYTKTGGLARQWAKAMCEEIPKPTVPMSNWDVLGIYAVLHAQFVGDEEY
jgi:hypothetical protein